MFFFVPGVLLAKTITNVAVVFRETERRNRFYDSVRGIIAAKKL